tara:strand:- start:14202 stop:14648 length:447 start_codon:yes stop_codon:yes gene_type:complete
MKLVNIQQIIPNSDNPRLVNTAKFEKLKESIKNLPQMLELRPIVVDSNNIILGGNMRYKALVELGYKEVYIIQAGNLTDEQKKEFIIKDNLNYGDWDYDILANAWDSYDLEQWGLDVWVNEDDIETHIDTEEKEEKKDNKEVCILCGK